MAVAKFLLVGASWGNINFSIKTFMQNFKIVKNCIANLKLFKSVLQNLFINISIILESFASL